MHVRASLEGKPFVSKTQGSRSTGRNRNAERSIRLLKTSFVQLLAEKPYEKITVTDVTTRADLNRGTFYAHFKSMSELRDTVFYDLTSSLSQMIDHAIDASFVEDPLPVLSQISGYVNDNRELFQKLMTSKTLEPFLNSLRADLRSHIHAYLSQVSPSDSPINLVVADYLSYGVLGVYRTWLDGEYGDATADDINQGLCALIRRTGECRE